MPWYFWVAYVVVTTSVCIAVGYLIHVFATISESLLRIADALEVTDDKA